MFQSQIMRSLVKAPTRFGVRSASSVMMKFEEAVAYLPMREAVKFSALNLKWTAEEYKLYADAHAEALIEHRFQRGDKIAIWMEDCEVKQVALLAYAKMGLVVYDIDPAISSVPDVRAFLTESQCKMVLFPPITEKQDNLRLLRYAIPELFHYSNTYGQHFHSKHWPNLKYFVHSGFDIEMGCLTFKGQFCKDPSVSGVNNKLDKEADDLPFYQKISLGNDGIVAGPMLNQQQSLGEPALGFLSNLIGLKYFEA